MTPDRDSPASVSSIVGFAGTQWGAQATLAAIAALAIAVDAIERLLEFRRS